MTDTPHADRGSIITYLDDSAAESGGVSLALVAGEGLIDPETDAVWVPVLRPVGELTLIDPGLIVEGSTPDAEPWTGQRPLEALATALAALADGMSDVDDRDPMAALVMLDLIDRFVDEIAPVKYDLYRLVEADPHGGLATVLSWIGSAVQEFEQGHFEDGRAELIVANAAMSELAP